MSIASDFSTANESPAMLANTPQTYSPKLRPSIAELNGRIKHSPVDMSLDMPPSPPANGSGRFPAVYRPDSTGSMGTPGSKRRSAQSVQRMSSATYHVLEEDIAEEATLASPERTHAGTPELVANDPKVERRSLRASFVSRAGGADAADSPIPPLSFSTISAQPPRLTVRSVFDDEAASSSPSPSAASSRSSELGLSGSLEPASGSGSEESGSVQGSDEHFNYSGKFASTPSPWDAPRRTEFVSLTACARLDEPSTLVPSTQGSMSARTSFSFEYADGNGDHGENSAFTAVRASHQQQPQHNQHRQQLSIGEAW
jgi:hypothetical protein